MKITNIFRSGLLLAFVTIFTNCTDSDKTYKAEAVEIQTYELTTTKTVAAIKALATTTPKEYTADDVIEAYVTSNDSEGNFFKSISFQDVPTASGTPIGFSVSVNKSMTFADGFYPGRKVYIKLKGLAIGMIFGSLQIGILDSTTTTGIAGIEPLDYQKYLFPSATVLKEDDLVRHMTLANSKLDVNQNTLLEVDNVQFANSSLGRTYFDIDSGGYATNQTIEDPNIGTTNICRISQYAPFSIHHIPNGKGSIRGVMTKYNSDYQFLVRYENDFKLTGARLVPVLNEDFSNGIVAWNAYSVSGAQVWAQTTYGNPSLGALMSGYSSGNQANEDWLISPAMNLTSYTSATLTFDTAAKFGGNLLKIYLSRNYTGSGIPTAATWTEFTGTLSSVTGNFVWTNSGNINISSFTGAANSKVYLAFKYTSTTSAAPSWELDNVKIIGN
jgi:hypothetical protein